MRNNPATTLDHVSTPEMSFRYGECSPNGPFFTYDAQPDGAGRWGRTRERGIASMGQAQCEDARHPPLRTFLMKAMALR
eukprot:scaffold229112_cov44-Tisochrysis_lutea.AAC.1